MLQFLPFAGRGAATLCDAFERGLYRLVATMRFYKALERKVVVVEDFRDRAEALESITQAIARYRQHRLHEGGAA